MMLIPIEEDESKNRNFRDAECRAILDVYPDFYRRVGFHPPWIGYFAKRDNDLVGCGGYKGKPKDGTVEVSYGSFRKYEGQGVGTEICRQLVSLALQTDPAVRITARTLMQHGASTSILQKNGFKLLGSVWDEDDGNVWEWEYKRL